MDYSKDFEEGYQDTELGYIHFMHHAGDSAPILFLHGFGADLMVWQRLFAYFNENFDIYTIDLLGHGLSSAPHIQYTVSAQSNSIGEFINKAIHTEPYIFGHSYGGWIGAYYAHANPLKGLVLEDPAGIKENFDEILRDGNVEEYKQKMVSTAMRLNNNKEYVLKSIVDNDFGEEQLSAERLSGIHARVLILWGESDNVIDPKFSGVISKHINGSTLKFIKGSGHNPHYDNPEEVYLQIINFVNAEGVQNGVGE
ncbi:MAG: alpha/beta fold hydrolase [Candidatus Micrarchaeia archaeon]